MAVGGCVVHFRCARPFPVFVLLGAFKALKTNDSLLRVLVAAAGLLGVSQLLYWSGLFPGVLLNGYARVFAVACLASPLISLLTRALLARIAVLAVAGTVVIGLSISWDRELGVFTQPFDEPTEQELLLLKAAELGDIVGVRRSLEAGADFRARDQHGRDALYHAADRGHAAIVTLLLVEGANPDTSEKKIGNVCRDDDCTVGRLLTGRTALIAAVANGHTEVVVLLLEAGADTTRVNELGFTALDMAEWTKRGEIAELLAASTEGPE